MKDTLRSFRDTALALLRPVLPVPGGLRSYELFALTVAIMIVGHIGYYFMPSQNEWRVADRILVPVFLVSVGYNAGRRPSWVLCSGAVIMMFLIWIMDDHLYGDILGVIVFLQLAIDPLMTRIKKSRIAFWGTNIVLVILFPVTNAVCEYGTLAVIMAMAGWINRNRGEMSPRIVKPPEYFAFATISFVACTQTVFGFSQGQLALVAAGAAFIMYLLFNFRQLVLNTITRRPQDFIEKTCSFIGHKSLEIYLIHAIAFQLILMIVLHRF